jgi:hypothetical protein
MAVARGILAFVVFILVFLLAIFAMNIITGIIPSLVFTGWDRIASRMFWGAAGSWFSVTVAKNALDRFFKNYPARTIAAVFMTMNAVLVADYLFLIPPIYWTDRFWPEIVQAITAVAVSYLIMWKAPPSMPGDAATTIGI